ncbi:MULTISPECIES: hypothetical protein [unclassified Streptomyces]|uniref:hypothetical protein n=1 Tax=unclassified Streptomyces TaxID=2593676 RepID=UPI000F70B3B3|nr:MULTISPECIES: hypothetical protein [unclassified Streptomyces]AZM61584.1 hypothetical protein DLM49_20400 [Streptomyces sp. WAC 01438]RSN01365.1 hypothetical protein DMA10_02255 [Streptomyces sp. WAC 01420]
MSQHHGVSSGRRYRDERDPRAWVAPAVATGLGAMLAPLAVLFGGLSVMATDSCGPDNCSAALTNTLSVIFGTLFYGGILAGGAWFAAWLLPWTRRWSVPRLWLAGLSLLPWLVVLALVFNLPEG